MLKGKVLKFILTMFVHLFTLASFYLVSMCFTGAVMMLFLAVTSLVSPEIIAMNVHKLCYVYLIACIPLTIGLLIKTEVDVHRKITSVKDMYEEDD